MIWDLIEESTFDKYFTDPSTTITRLLLDENIITELKNQNPRLLYLATHKQQFMNELIDYVIILPQPEDTHDRCYKLPYISSQLLAIDSNLIYSEFFREEVDQKENEYWVKLLSFLEGAAASNEVLMGYFQKVMNNLYAGNKTKTTRVVCDQLQKFANLLPNGSVVDILKKCLVLLTTAQGAVLSQRKLILNRVVELFAIGQEQLKNACSDILSEVIAKFQAFSSGDVLLQELLLSQKLFSIYECQSSVSVNEFLSALIKKSQQRTINEQDESVPLFNLPEQHRQRMRGYLQRETANIRAIAKSTGFILNQNKQTVRKSNKSLYSLLGLVRLVLEEGLSSFVDQALLSFLWNLVLLYPYNNILHVIILKIFTSSLTGAKEDVRNLFLATYQHHLLNLAKQHLPLLKQLIYTVWKEAKLYQTHNHNPEFNEFAKVHLQPLAKYDTESHQQKSKPQQKLIVDEEDKPTPHQTQQIPSIQQGPQLLAAAQKEEGAEIVSQQEKNQNKVGFFGQFEIENNQRQNEGSASEKQQQSDSNFFNDWDITDMEHSFESKPKQPAKADAFNDFTSFF